MSQQPTAKRGIGGKIPLLLIAAVVVAGVLLSIFYSTQQVALTPRIAKIVITGPLSYSTPPLFGASVGVEEYIKLVKQAEDDPTVKAVILVFDSPGGTVSASYDLYTAVKSLASKKVVVSYARGTLASGAYMAACPSTRIYASPSSLIGSIGVYASVLSVEGLLGKLGVRVYTVKTGELKDIGSPYRNMTAEDLRVMQEIVDEYFRLFRSIVLEWRKNVSSGVFTGRPYGPQEALKAGLIDGITTFEEALNKTRELAGLPPYAPVVELKPPQPGLLSLLFGALGSRTPLSVPSVVYLAMWPEPQYIVLP